MGNAPSTLTSMMFGVAEIIRACKSENYRGNPLMDDLEQRLHQAEAEAKKAKEAWNAGVRPEEYPTQQEFEAAKEKNRYDRALFHFAIAGIAGGGKSSLVNAFRAVRYGDEDYAPTGIVETTKVTGRYPDPRDGVPFVWYDFPGSGTISVSDWKYFNANGLFIFDCIIVVVNDRFMESDSAIIRNCERFGIPCFLVRSKSDQHIMNSVREKGQSAAEARANYIRDSRQSVQKNLSEAKLSDKKVYMVSAWPLLNAVSGMEDPDAIDEGVLIRDLYASVRARRGTEVQS